MEPLKTVSAVADIRKKTTGMGRACSKNGSWKGGYENL
jgi:hypothetical protein